MWEENSNFGFPFYLLTDLSATPIISASMILIIASNTLEHYS